MLHSAPYTQPVRRCKRWLIV